MSAPGRRLRVLPLGGLGEIGKNMYVFEYGDEIVVIDAGLMFPEEEMFGVDLVVPDVTYLRERRDHVRAFLITHAHEDHVGGLPYVLPHFPGVPIYASTLARGLLGGAYLRHFLFTVDYPAEELRLQRYRPLFSGPAVERPVETSATRPRPTRGRGLVVTADVGCRRRSTHIPGP